MAAFATVAAEPLAPSAPVAEAASGTVHGVPGRITTSRAAPRPMAALVRAEVDLDDGPFGTGEPQAKTRAPTSPSSSAAAEDAPVAASAPSPAPAAPTASVEATATPATAATATPLSAIDAPGAKPVRDILKQNPYLP
jgi:hypothetical protein